MPVSTVLPGTVDELLARSRQLRDRHAQLLSQRAEIRDHLRSAATSLDAASDRLQKLRSEVSKEILRSSPPGPESPRP